MEKFNLFTNHFFLNSLFWKAVHTGIITFLCIFVPFWILCWCFSYVNNTIVLFLFPYALIDITSYTPLAFKHWALSVPDEAKVRKARRTHTTYNVLSSFLKKFHALLWYFPHILALVVCNITFCFVWFCFSCWYIKICF